MNNREIKFRIWDRQNKEFAEWTNRDPFFDTSHGKIFFWERVRKEDGSYDGDIILQDYGDRFVLQQYTGLKDKNGAEIYEGDIVQIVEKDETRIYDIVFSHGYFGLNRGPKSKHALMYPYTDVFEIVGNIMQNPELIKTNE